MPARRVVFALIAQRLHCCLAPRKTMESMLHRGTEEKGDILLTTEMCTKTILLFSEVLVFLCIFEIFLEVHHHRLGPQHLQLFEVNLTGLVGVEEIKGLSKDWRCQQSDVQNLNCRSPETILQALFFTYSRNVFSFKASGPTGVLKHCMSSAAHRFLDVFSSMPGRLRSQAKARIQIIRKTSKWGWTAKKRIEKATNAIMSH